MIILFPFSLFIAGLAYVFSGSEALNRAVKVGLTIDALVIGIGFLIALCMVVFLVGSGGGG